MKHAHILIAGLVLALGADVSADTAVTDAALHKTSLDRQPALSQYARQIWLPAMDKRLAQRVPNNADRQLLLRLIYAEARRVNLAPELVMAIIQVESAFNRQAVSHAGARGLMQVMPFWTRELPLGDDLFSVHTNLRYGCSILRRYLDQEQGNILRALARYNGSLNHSYGYADKVMTTMQTHWRRP